MNINKERICRDRDNESLERSIIDRLQDQGNVFTFREKRLRLEQALRKARSQETRRVEGAWRELNRRDN